LYSQGFDDIAIEFVERFSGMSPIVKKPHVKTVDLVTGRLYDLERVGEYISKAMGYHDGITSNAGAGRDDDRDGTTGGLAATAGGS
jgi:hypothetical protein